MKTDTLEISTIVDHFTKLYSEEIEAGEVDGNVIHEWWNSTKEQYSDAVSFDDVEKAILSKI